MRTLEEIMSRCVHEEDTGCKIYAGHCDKFGPRLYAPNLRTGKMAVQYGRAAVWQLHNQKALPGKWRVFGDCDNKDCLEITHIKAMTVDNWGRKVAASGARKGSLAHVLANRKIVAARSKLTAELVHLIETSPKTGVQLASELGLPRTTISRVRTGQTKLFKPVGGLFSGLMNR